MKQVELEQRKSLMSEALTLLSVLVLWVVLQAWVLPYFGVNT